MSEHEIRHANAGEGYDPQEPKARNIVILALVSLVSLIVVIFGVSAYFDHIYEGLVLDKVLKAPNEQLQALRAKENDALTKYSYADKQKGVVRIPVDRAME